MPFPLHEQIKIVPNSYTYQTQKLPLVSTTLLEIPLTCRLFVVVVVLSKILTFYNLQRHPKCIAHSIHNSCVCCVVLCVVCSVFCSVLLSSFSVYHAITSFCRAVDQSQCSKNRDQPITQRCDVTPATTLLF